MKVYLVLGCNGHGVRGDIHSIFTYCKSAKNPILDLSRVHAERREELVGFLDNACGLFDNMVHDRNKVSNIISFLYKKLSVVDDDMLHAIQLFMQMHRQCGTYLILITKEDYECQM